MQQRSGNESFSRTSWDRRCGDRHSAPVSERIFRHQELSTGRNGYPRGG